MRWPLILRDMERQVVGPEDEFDERVNGDPDSVHGEEDEGGYDEMADWPDEEEDEDE